MKLGLGFFVSLFLFQSIAIAGNEGMETQFKFNCAKMSAALPKLQPSKVVEQTTLGIISSVAKNGLGKPGNSILSWAWEKTQWPKIFRALQAFDQAVRDGHIQINESVEWVQAPAGSNPQARELRQLVRVRTELTALIKGVDGKMGLEGRELDLGFRISQSQERSTAISNEGMTSAHRDAAAEVETLTKQHREMTSRIDEIDRSIQRLQKPTVTPTSKVSTAPKVEADPKIEEKRLSELAAAQSQRGLLEGERSQLKSKLDAASGELQEFEDAVSATRTAAASSTNQLVLQQKAVSLELEQRQRQLLQATESYDKKSRELAVKALYESWGVWDAYQAEIRKRADEEEEAAEAQRKKEAVAADLRAKQEAADALKKRGEEALAAAKRAADEATKKTKVGGTTDEGDLSKAGQRKDSKAQ